MSFTQLGLELNDSKKKRVFEAKIKHNKDIVRSTEEHEQFERYQQQRERSQVE